MTVVAADLASDQIHAVEQSGEQGADDSEDVHVAGACRENTSDQHTAHERYQHREQPLGRHLFLEQEERERQDVVGCRHLKERGKGQFDGDLGVQIRHI